MATDTAGRTVQFVVQVNVRDQILIPQGVREAPPETVADQQARKNLPRGERIIPPKQVFLDGFVEKVHRAIYRLDDAYFQSRLNRRDPALPGYHTIRYVFAYDGVDASAQEDVDLSPTLSIDEYVRTVVGLVKLCERLWTAYAFRNHLYMREGNTVRIIPDEYGVNVVLEQLDRRDEASVLREPTHHLDVEGDGPYIHVFLKKGGMVRVGS